jgi:hypothetical protein
MRTRTSGMEVSCIEIITKIGFVLPEAVYNWKYTLQLIDIRADGGHCPGERELVRRLASLLWRLRRATTIETGLFEIQADQLSEIDGIVSITRTSKSLFLT